MEQKWFRRGEISIGDGGSSAQLTPIGLLHGLRAAGDGEPLN